MQHLLNSADRLTPDPDPLIGRLSALLDLDSHRLRVWLFARCVQESANSPDLAALARLLAP